MSMSSVINSALQSGLTRLSDCFPVTMTWNAVTYSGVAGPTKYSSEMMEGGILPDFDTSITFDSTLFTTVPQAKQTATIEAVSYMIVYVQYIRGSASVNIFLRRYA